MDVKLSKLKVGVTELVFFGLGILAAGLIFGGYLLMNMEQTNLAYNQSGLDVKWMPGTVTRWKQPIELMAKKYNIDANFVAIIMTLESGGYVKADSGLANGLMQITPYTAKDISQKFLKQPVDKYDLGNPETNIEFGVAYLAYLRDEFCYSPDKESPELCVEQVAAGYNGGPGAANRIYKGLGLEDDETLVYSRDAFNMWRERKADKSPTYNRWLQRGGQSLIDKASAETSKK